jgi:VanZ family protein
LRAARRAWRSIIGSLRFGAAGLALSCEPVFAFVIQVLQAYLPSRQPALADVLWNSVGAALGIAMALSRSAT